MSRQVGFIRKVLKLWVLFIVFVALFPGSAHPAQAAIAISGFSVQSLSGPVSNCQDASVLASMTITVSGTPGGSGTFTLYTNLFGVNQSVPTITRVYPDSDLGNPKGLGIHNGGAWTAPGDTPRIEFDVQAGGISYGGAVLYLNCVTGSAAVFYTGGFASGASTVLFRDGRINNRPEDAAQTAAIYCAGDGSVTVWAVNNSVGKFAFTATKDDIDKVPANPDQNMLIKQALNIALYRLHGGKLQVNAPNGYVFIWDGC